MFEDIGWKSSGPRVVREMVLVLFLVLYFSLTTTTQSLEENIHNEFQGIHLTLHHVHGLNSSTAFFDILARDQVRVQALEYRLGGSITISKSSVSIPLNPGAPIEIGNYYIKLGLGTPTKYYTMIFDTGSALTWLQCQPCKIYCHPQIGPIFNPSSSSTYKFVPCDAPVCNDLESATLNAPSCTTSNICSYEATYGDGSYSIGYLNRDMLTFETGRGTKGLTFAEYIYGCGQDTQGLFGKSAGLVGMARNKLSMFSQLSSKYGMSMFSYCLPTSTSTGTFTIGPSASKTYVFTPMITDPRDPSLYFLRLTGITVDGIPLKVSPLLYRTSTIIDSGTVITRLPIRVYEALQEAFVKNMISKRYKQAPSYSILDTCFKANGKSMTLPEISIIFSGGARLKLGADNIVIQVEDGIKCLAFASNGATDGISIIGNRQQETSAVVYDVTNSRIGFAARGCN
ncbi:hypothetical protein GIB67_040002 [Kingdonia uniflora]|uniref:Peptidase A1 domain-containing protein n=1 Tax=Kingdonia uniflora TaxID=39325 RepID=A0A7J7LI31_9MAGN|nr:hypothetical protein GIB67_040002 [Kingdonia uniflora]